MEEIPKQQYEKLVKKQYLVVGLIVSSLVFSIAMIYLVYEWQKYTAVVAMNPAYAAGLYQGMGCTKVLVPEFVRNDVKATKLFLINLAEMNENNSRVTMKDDTLKLMQRLNPNITLNKEDFKNGS